MTRRLSVLVPLLALAATACGGGAPDASARTAPDTTPFDVAPSATEAPPSRVWTGDSARAMMSAVDSARADSLAWAADEAKLYEQRKGSMQKYADCMRDARTVPGPVRAQLEAACANLPDAPR